jgi:hypothetical protein
MSCCCDQSAPSPYANGSAGGDMSASGDYSDQLLGSKKLCFKCATFWIVIVVLAFLLMSRSGK